MSTEADAVSGAELDAELAELLDVETFEPPAGFREQALLKDPAVYEQAASDPQAWWVAQAEELDWFQKWNRVLDDDDPPFYKWFVGGSLNVSYNCLDRHVIAGRGDRVAFHWRGEDGQERDITYADLLAEVERFASALKGLGVEKGDVVGIYLPMIPEVVVAMLACARIGAPHNVVFGGFSAEAVRERMEFSEAKVLITVDGAARKGKTAAVKDRVDEVMGDLDTLEKIVVVKSKGTPCEMKDGRDIYYEDILAAADPACPAPPRLPRGAARCRASALHPLHLRLHGQAQGDPPHHRRLPDGRLGHASLRLRPQGGVRRLLVRRRRGLGHRALLHRLWAPVQRGDLGDVGGRARLPQQGHLVGDRRALRRHDPLLRPPRDPRLHQVGGRVARQARPAEPAPARIGRRADQPQGVALVPQGDRRGTVSDRGYLVADRDRRDHDHAPAWDHRDQARLGHAALPGRLRRGPRRVHRRAGGGGAGPARAHASVAVDAAHPLQGGGALHRDLLQA